MTDHQDASAEITDGHHTLGELYDHRRALTAALCKALAPDSWRSKAHHPDDDPMFEGGYFKVGIDLPTGTITYHYKLSHWDDFAGVVELEHAPKWDGAPPGATVERLLSWCAAPPRTAAEPVGVEGEDLGAWVAVPRRWLVRQGSYLYLLSQGGHRSFGPVIALADPAPPGTPAELAGLPAEVRALVHAVDAVRDRWAEADEAVRAELWGKAHAAADAVWHRELIR